MATVNNAGIKDYQRLHFNWMFVNWCNYQCSYCSSASWMADQFSKKTSPAKFQLVLRKLQRLTTEFEVDLYGGEPTLHPDFDHVIDSLTAMPNCQLIEIKTNLSKSLAFFQNISKHKIVRLAASYHAEYHSQKFIDKCIALKDFNFYCHINIPDDPAGWPQILELIDTLEQEGVRYDLNMLYSTKEYSVNYPPNFSDVFEDKIANISDPETYRLEFDDGSEQHLPAFEMYKSGLAKFTGYTCQARLYEITAEGDFINSCTGRKLMPIIIKNEDFETMVTCPQELCHSDMMFNFYKYK